MALFASILTFLVVAAAFLLIWLFAGTSKGQEVVRQRMEAVRKAERRGGDVALGVGLLRDEMLSGVPFLHRLMLHWSWSTRLRELISQAGLKMKPAALAMLSCIVALLAYLIGVHFFHVFLLALLMGLAAGVIPIGLWPGCANGALGGLKNTFLKHSICSVELSARAMPSPPVSK